MSKLLSQGGFGCVYHPGIKCDGSKDKKNFVSKLQINNYASFNEIEIGKIIEKIPNYELFFLPIIEYCKINIAEIDNKLIEKCNTLHDNTNLVLMKMNYIKNIDFYDFKCKTKSCLVKKPKSSSSLTKTSKRVRFEKKRTRRPKTLKKKKNYFSR